MDKNRWLDRWKVKVRSLKEETYALFLAYRHPQTPWYAKVAAGIVTAYAFSPIDLIPDFIPILGYLDDLILVPLGIALAVKLIPEEIMQACRAEAQVQLQSGKPVSRVAAVVIILLWIFTAYFAIRWILNLTGK